MRPSRQPAGAPIDTLAALPDPGRAGTLDDLVEQLRLLKVWAGDPSYERIKDRVNAAWAAAGRPRGEMAGKTTILDCFRPGRRRLNPDLVAAVVHALRPDVGYVTQWRQALRVIGGHGPAAAQVRVQDALPHDLVEFTGRAAELDQLRQALHQGQQDGGAVVISAIAGMAGVGKTQLAIHAGHLLARERPFDRVLFANLRGFHTDQTQPPADPGAVLDGFLRLLGVPGQRIPHDLPARAAAYRDRLAGTRTLVVLDNAVNEDQVRPLLTAIPGCPVLITSRRSLTDLPDTAHLTVDVFTPDEAMDFLTQTTAEIPVGHDPHAPARIAYRCGYLPLALCLVAGHIRGTPGWTLTDHADRLDERHHERRLDAGVELALHLSYRHLPAEQQRLLRLAGLHPGPDLDANAAAALAGTDLTTAQNHLRSLCDDHLLHWATPGRYTFHDLVRAYVADRARDQDRPFDRRAALTRLFDYYLATAAAAMDTLYPTGPHRGHTIPPSVTPAPDLTDSDTARAWLDTELPSLVVVAAHTATHGWLAHTTRLSATLFRYLNSGHATDAATIHTHALYAADHAKDPIGQAHALTNLGVADLLLSQYRTAADHLRQAIQLFRHVGDQAGQARALGNLGLVETRLGQYRPAADHHNQALQLFQQVGDQAGQARALSNLGLVETRLGQYQPATDHHEQALRIYRRVRDGDAEASALRELSEVEVALGRYRSASQHLNRALHLSRQAGNRDIEAWTLNSLGTLDTHLDQPAQATQHHQRALDMFRDLSERDGEASALNGLGEAAHTAGHPNHALRYHTAAHTLATDIDSPDKQARAHTGLGHAHRALQHEAEARRHFGEALALYTALAMPEAAQARTALDALTAAP